MIRLRKNHLDLREFNQLYPTEQLPAEIHKAYTPASWLKQVDHALSSRVFRWETLIIAVALIALLIGLTVIGTGADSGLPQ